MFKKPVSTIQNKIAEMNVKNKSLYKWMDVEIDELILLHSQSLNDYEISKKMKIAVNDIQSKITELKNEKEHILRKAPKPVEMKVIGDDVFNLPAEK
jgi:hypothetical protein